MASRWKQIGFNRQQAPTRPAVYALYVDTQCVYIGSTTNLRERLTGHHHRKTLAKFGAPSVKYRPTESVLLRQLEAALIKRLTPRLNRRVSRGPMKTVRLSAELRRALKLAAAIQGRTIGDIASEALTEWLMQRQEAGARLRELLEECA